MKHCLTTVCCVALTVSAALAQQKKLAQSPTSSDDLTIDSLRQRAAGGDVKAQAQLGNSYLFGKGVTKDAAEALTWFGDSLNSIS